MGFWVLGLAVSLWVVGRLVIGLRVVGLGFGRQDWRIVVSVRPGWVRNYFAYFFVYSARCVHAYARARTVPGTPVGRRR